ncbi:MAG: 4-hydroxy-tetrahydrodipicolinate reductase [Alphaproteobacteria bacterium]|nr:4-hydroxy-tetrahydrodipicolinate reductase [Alphaproteobacteria bacterium]MBF0250313.1 4-hydroxy-tetrahydrodipicolinate reductase [Alphaproteobacteria bacterium]
MKIGIVGAAGRMGRMLLAATVAADGAVLSGGTEAAGHPKMGQDLGRLVGGADLGVALTADPKALFAASDAVIDFTVPSATATHALLAAETGTHLVIGTTGLGAPHQDAVDRAAETVTIVQAANFSIGVNLLLGLVERAATILDDSYDIEILDMHHRHKVDAPSGTALALARAAAQGRGVELDAVACKERDGIIGARPRGEIGIQTLRGGGVVGDHTVIFADMGERVEIGHKAGSREIFAGGAVRAALWTAGQKPGLYSMQDVLGF